MMGVTIRMLIKQRNRIFELKVPRSLKVIYVEGKGVGLFANRNFKKGEIAVRFKADLVPCSKASAEAVQVSEHECFDTKWLVPESFMNHGCDPTTKLDVKNKSYVAVKNIKKNDEITFNYLTTDWDM